MRVPLSVPLPLNSSFPPSQSSGQKRKKKLVYAWYSKDTPRFKGISEALLSCKAAAVFLSGQRRQGQQKIPKKGQWMHGKATTPALWCPSAEQIVQTVRSHLLFSASWLCATLHFILQGRLLAGPISKQSSKERALLPSSPEN